MSSGSTTKHGTRKQTQKTQHLHTSTGSLTPHQIGIGSTATKRKDINNKQNKPESFGNMERRQRIMHHQTLAIGIGSTAAKNIGKPEALPPLKTSARAS